MPLRLLLKPYERLIINGASIRNGERQTACLVETQCKLLREREIIYEEDADTDCKKLAVTLQKIYFSNDPSELNDVFLRQVQDLFFSQRSYAPYLHRINEQIDANQHYKAIKIVHELIAYEQSLLEGSSWNIKAG